MLFRYRNGTAVFHTVIFTSTDIAQSVGANHVSQSARDSAVKIVNIHSGSFLFCPSFRTFMNRKPKNVYVWQKDRNVELGLDPDSIRISGAGSGFRACSISWSLKVVTNEKGEAVGDVLTIIC